MDREKAALEGLAYICVTVVALVLILSLRGCYLRDHEMHWYKECVSAGSKGCDGILREPGVQVEGR